MRLGIGVGRDRIIGVVEGKETGAVGVDLSRGSRITAGAGEDATDRLERAFAELVRRLEEDLETASDGAQVAVALLPPLAELRVVPLPPLSEAEAEAVITRDAGRHFMRVTGSTVVGVSRRRRRAPVLAAAAPASLLEAVRVAAVRTGWIVERIVPAQAAWWSLLQDREAGAAVVVEGGTAHVIREDLEGPYLRRVLAGSAANVMDALGEGPRIVVAGDRPGAPALADELRGRGGDVSFADEGGRSAAELAARRARKARPELVPPALGRERVERSRRRAGWMVAAAVLLVMAAGAVHLMAAQQELDAVRDARASLAEEVAPLLAIRDSLDALRGQVRAVNELTDRSPAWTRALVEVAALLPTDAHLTSLVADGEFVEMEAAGQRAGAAIQALRGAGSLEDVRLEGIVERELDNGETVVERFRLSARMAHPTADTADTAGTAEGGP